jgi:chemotaxis protein MotB
MLSETDEIPAPIIIKRKKVVLADEHHGGAWKVAYADFVTAMMAFFLLMWLLNATTEEQRKGLADYFNPSIPISRISGGGADGLNGSSIFTEDTLAQAGTGAKSTSRDPSSKSSTTPNEPQTVEINEKADNLKAAIDSAGAPLSDHILITQSPEGILIELVDSQDEPLFKIGSSASNELLEILITSISTSFGVFENEIKIVGHTDARQFDRNLNYNNWNLSADRAATARRLLIAGGIDTAQVTEISGKADTQLLIKDDPYAPQNRRISIMIKTGAPKALEAY